MPDEFAAEADLVDRNGAPAISADALRRTFGYFSLTFQARSAPERWRN
ncbi:hypothetical protein [Microtetraspora malaysiensis]|nr:hypothetical protein [Microtetraspora malaysiensis]